MGYLTLGSWTIPYAWIAFLAAYFYVDIRNRKAESQWPNAFEHLLWVYLISWKASYIIFYLEPFLSAPMSILYFDGGWKGHLVALAVTLFVFIRRKMIDGLGPLLVLWLQFATLYQIIVSSLSGQYIVVILAAVALVAVEKKKKNIWSFALLFATLVMLGDWLNLFLFISVALILLNVVYMKNLAYVAPVVIATLVGMFMMNEIEMSNGESKEISQIELNTHEGERYSIREEEKSVVILNFFATWCPPCKAEMPHLQSFAENLPEDVAIIGVNLTARDDGERALRKFIEKYNVTYPILLDVDDTYGDAYGVLSMPTTIILKDGKEVERIVGPVSEESLRKLVKQYEKVAQN